MKATFLGCGVAGPTLEADERALLAELGPATIVLFARNVASVEQLLALVEQLHALPERPLVAIDLEGGRVNRLARLIGPLPAPTAAASCGAEAIRSLAETIGAACAFFEIDVAFAPVVDVARTHSYVGGEGRCLGGTVDEVIGCARHYLEGIERFGVATCLKHYPGLGSGEVDSHKELPRLGELVSEDIGVFHALATPARAVMISHGLAPQLGEPCAPASLSKRVVTRLSTSACGLVFSDDLEMGALEVFGSLGERVAGVLLAGCDQALVCNAMAARRDVTEHVRTWAARDVCLAAAVARGARRTAAFSRPALVQVEWDDVLAHAERARALAGEAA